MKPPTVIAEIGGNHMGSIKVAKRMIEIIGGYCTEHFNLDPTTRQVPYVKFQKRTMDPALYPSWSAPHPHPHQSYGDTYLAHREALEFEIDDHRTLKYWAERSQVGWSCSVWDIQAAREVIALNPEWIKIPSACNLDFDLLSYVYANYEGPVHISLGMTTHQEIHDIAWHIQPDLGRTVFYACTSGYPVDAADVCLRELEWLRDNYGPMLLGIGFSGHHNGIGIDQAAVALGATFIERHFTLNRTWKGTDHAASLEPDGFRKLLRDCALTAAALEPKRDGILAIERPQRDKLKTVTEAP